MPFAFLIINSLNRKYKAMKHEKFKIFRVIDAVADADLNAFLNGGGVVPKSISVDRYYNGQKLVLIGYEKTDADSEHQYHIVEKEISDVNFYGLKHIGDLIEKEAIHVGGVVCQDIAYTKETIQVTFLTTKK
jgi:hypothetical protein